MNLNQGKSAILKDFYVDDVLTGSDCIETVLEIRKPISFILNDAKFNLKEWCSNDPRILKGIPSEDLEKNSFFTLAMNLSLKHWDYFGFLLKIFTAYGYIYRRLKFIPKDKYCLSLHLSLILLGF